MKYISDKKDIIKNILDHPAEEGGIEFKRLGRELKISKVLETIVAMANTDGGYIILGIDDPEKTKLKGYDRIFEDKIEVESPGLFPSNITSNNIGFVRSEGYRNDIIVKHLREFPDPPNLDQNEGVRAIREEMNKGSLYPPVFETYPKLQDSVKAILYNAIINSEWEKVSSYLTKKEKYITNEIVRNIINNSDRSKVSRLLNKWVSKGLLIKIETGAKKTAKYRLPIKNDC